MSGLYAIEKLLKGTFPLSFNIIDRYHREYHFLTEKSKCETYKKGYFCGGRNTIKLVTYEGKIVISQKLQKYVLKWYHTYLLHPGPDRTDEMILQNLCYTGIRKSVQKEVTNCDVCQRKKR